MLMVGLTGGIGAGKSAVADRLVALGAVLADADRLARDVVAPGTDGLREVVAAFGAQVLGPDGALDRPVLAARVFGDAAARRRLEQIVHPRVRAATAAVAAAAPADAVLVNDVPLLVEVGLAPTYHLVVVVEAAAELRVGRLVHGRGMTPEQAYARIRAQADDVTRRAAADVVLGNDADLAALHARVDRLWQGRLLPYEANLRAGRPAGRPDRVELAEPDPDRSRQAARLTARIRHFLGRPARLAHIGSTAVPDLHAEDVLDLQLGVASTTEADEVADRLAAAGLLPAPVVGWGAAGDPERGQVRLHASADPGRPARLWPRVPGSPEWRLALLIRDHLRADPARRVAYAGFKRRLAAEAPDRAGYEAGKAAWFDEERGEAERWAGTTGWRPPEE